MLEVILGVILLLIPFLLLTLFQDKNKGFVYIVFFVLVSQSLIGFLAQVFGVFNYLVILSATILVDVGVLFYWFRRKNLSPRQQNFCSSGEVSPRHLPLIQKFVASASQKRIDYFFFVVLAFAILTLFQVHYNYTGKINIATDQTVGYHQVQNMKYVYPYFSDEWYAVSLIQGATELHSLPVHNLLTGGSFYNLELFFHSFVAQLMLLLQLNPLTQYTLLAIFLNSLFVVSVYVFLKLNKISSLTSAIASMLLLYIASGANLPYIWHLIPFNLGLTFSVLAMCFMKMDKFKMSCLAVLLTLLFYPPLFLFSVLAFFVYLTPKINALKESVINKILSVYLPIVSGIIAAGFILALVLEPKTVFYLLSRIWFDSFVAPLLPRYAVYGVIFWPILVLLFFGLAPILKRNKIIFYQFILGAMLWFAYSLTTKRFFIEYERVAVFTALMSVIISAFGIEAVLRRAKSLIPREVGMLILVAFFVCIPFYTKLEGWMSLVYVNPASMQIVSPKSPANNYLTQEDLNIFKDIKGKKFLSLPWKGTVIGVATNNYPIFTKEGTISIGSSFDLNNFARSDCQGKQKLAKSLNLDYIYLYSFDCKGFEKMAESSEKLILYKVNSN